MISVLVTILVLCLIFGLIFAFLMLLARLIPIPDPFLRIAQAILGIIFLIILIYELLPLAHIHSLP